MTIILYYILFAGGSSSVNISIRQPAWDTLGVVSRVFYLFLCVTKKSPECESDAHREFTHVITASRRPDPAALEKKSIKA